MKASSVWREGFRSELGNGRGHAVVVDWPPEDGGRDAGPSGLELAAMSLAGCVTTIFAAVARKRRLPYDRLRADLTAERPRGAPTIERVRGVVTVASSAPKEDVETVLRLTIQQCPVGVLFERAGVASEWELVVDPA